jgi:phospholipid/cholesterol/gamma-HCH transport system ATP-binding protein
MTVREYLQFVARIKIKGVSSSERASRIEGAMRRTRVDDMAGRHCGKLSKGYRQRVGLAQAILHNPEVLILDEPTAGLDPIAASEFDELVLYLRRALDLTIVMVTHDLDTLSRTCDRVAVLVDRRVIVDTLPRIQKNEHPWIREYFHGPRGQRVSAGGGRVGA